MLKPDDVLQAALAKAITDSVTPEIKNEIFQKALLEFLFNKNHYGDRNPLTEAFQRALQDSTRKLADEIVNSPECKVKVTTVMQAALDEALPKLQKVISDGLAEKIRNVFSRY